ncbi:Respiratory supercomplex factor 1, mitochondrial [Maublancomyces gigas]|uniref:Respiratory supercomplex factor 1, mitochondrial n=1 Tax=Discina gigas TaxID=1032678 RepID=A0ABR3GNQ1_9PEZI
MSRPLPSSFDDNLDFFEENRWTKFSRRLKEEPLIPLGCALTCAVLFQATRSMRLGDKVRTNRMFRARIYAQGFTLAAMLGGSVYYKKQRDEEKEVDVKKAAVKAKEKQSAWIRELEIRDKEDKERQRSNKRYAERRREARAAEKEAGDE